MSSTTEFSKPPEVVRQTFGAEQGGTMPCCCGCLDHVEVPPGAVPEGDVCEITQPTYVLVCRTSDDDKRRGFIMSCRKKYSCDKTFLKHVQLTAHFASKADVTPECFRITMKSKNRPDVDVPHIND